jgi:uncharacterized protein (DUF342 family)
MTPERPQSVIGNLIDLRDGEIALQRFLVKREDGLFVVLSKLESIEDLRVAVDRIFTSGTYFLDLDYPRFLKLLYGTDLEEARQPGAGGESTSLIRFADDIVAFLPERKDLYKGVKISDGEAEYFFEPVYLESTVEESLYGEDKDGARVVVGFENKKISELAALTVDEFIADMWLKGICYGIDVDAVRTAIKTGAAGRVVIARRLEAVPGKAADIQELTKELHRDDAPKELPNGRLDLRQFTNRFPQINKRVRLLKKIPRVLGEVGYELTGNPIDPPLPKDFDLTALSGPGTAVETIGGVEFIVSQQDGFLNIDTKTNQISITEKIINREGVSVRTTGDLLLTGDEYEEHGEVQEKRTIEGNNIVMHADVFGTVSSRGGTILLKSNLVGGSAINREGDITIEGVASGAVLQTRKGTITLKRADNCTIIGTRVIIEKATNCDVLSDEISITEASGCAIVGKAISLGNAGTHKQSEMLVFVQVPDLAEFDRKIGAIKDKIAEIELSTTKKSQALEGATSQPEVKKYLLLAAMLKKGEITLTPEQQGNLQNLAATVNPTLRLVAKINAEIKLSFAEKSELADQAALLAQHKKDAEEGASCSIADITGEILVRTLKVTPDNVTALYDLPPKNLRAALRGSSITGERVYSGHSGSLDWKFTAPE